MLAWQACASAPHKAHRLPGLACAFCFDRGKWMVLHASSSPVTQHFAGHGYVACSSFRICCAVGVRDVESRMPRLWFTSTFHQPPVLACRTSCIAKVSAMCWRRSRKAAIVASSWTIIAELFAPTADLECGLALIKTRWKPCARQRAVPSYVDS